MSDTNDRPVTPADDTTLQHAQEAIDEAKAAAAEVHRPEEDDLVDEGAPVADRPEPADGPAPAA